MSMLNLIYARARNGTIGKDNRMPWHLPEDMAHFKQHTAGAVVIMGRKTWDSLPPRFRPLPDRVNVVVTRQIAWQAEGAQVAHSLEQALAAARSCSKPVWVIGGAELYAQALPLASTVVVTEIEQDFDGDAFAPVLNGTWAEISRERHSSSNGLQFSFVEYRRKPASSQQ